MNYNIDQYGRMQRLPVRAPYLTPPFRGARLFDRKAGTIDRKGFGRDSHYVDYFIGALAAGGGKIHFIPHGLAHQGPAERGAY
jgi:hypothetical protein